MVTTAELGVVLLAVVGLLFARRLLSSIKALAVNAVGGVLALVVASWLDFGVSLTPLTLIVTALAGISGAIFVVLLSYGGVTLPAGDASQLLIEQGRNLLDQILYAIQ